jgi:hypothetical protein
MKTEILSLKLLIIKKNRNQLETQNIYIETWYKISEKFKKISGNHRIDSFTHSDVKNPVNFRESDGSDASYGCNCNIHSFSLNFLFL